MKTELTETLIRALQDFADAETKANGESAPVHAKLNELGLADEILSEIGLAWLVPEQNEPEPNEPPKKKYTVHIREVWEGDFEVEAADYDEAYERACDLEYHWEDLAFTDRDVDVKESDRTE